MNQVSTVPLTGSYTMQWFRAFGLIWVLNENYNGYHYTARAWDETPTWYPY